MKLGEKTTLVINDQRSIQDLAKHLGWSFNGKMVNDYFRKNKLHLKGTKYESDGCRNLLHQICYIKLHETISCH